MNKAVTFVRLAVLRFKDRPEKRIEVSPTLGPISVPFLQGFGYDFRGCPTGPVFGQVVYTHQPGDMTVSGLPVYRDWP